ncbi:MAG: cell wall-binding repeat-containing protein, partial [Buchananella hordeovulneris]|nr:cell wall-binding repeat-containing protein [Buchananella hordeovulneris]
PTGTPAGTQGEASGHSEDPASPEPTDAPEVAVSPQPAISESAAAAPGEPVSADRSAGGGESGRPTAPPAQDREGAQMEAEPSWAQPLVLGTDAPVVANNRSPVGVLKIRNPKGEKFKICTGTLISDYRSATKWVITARQCFLNANQIRAIKPKPAVNAAGVTFHLDTYGQGEGIRARTIHLSENMDLALVELTREVTDRAPLRLSSAHTRKGNWFSTLSYAGRTNDPWSGLARRQTHHSITTRGSGFSTKCGDTTFGADSSSYLIPGDIGAPAIASDGGLLGVLTGNHLIAFSGPKGERYRLEAENESRTRWAGGNAIELFLASLNSKTGFNIKPFWYSAHDCKRQDTITSALLVATSDRGESWSTYANNGKIAFHHPAGAQSRVERVGAPVAFSVFVCRNGRGSCNVELHYLSPTGWSARNLLADNNSVAAGLPNKVVSPTSQTVWGKNLAGRLADPVYTNEPYRKPVRLAGRDRHETSRLLFKEMGFHRRGVAVVVSGSNYADAVIAGPLAAAYRTGIILVPGTLDDSTRYFLAANAIHKVFIVGGHNAVSPNFEVIGEFRAGVKSTRFDGSSRYETSAKVAQHLRSIGAGDYAFLADGGGFPDALAAGAAAGSRNGYVLLTATAVSGGKLVDATPQSVKKLARGRLGTVAVGGKAVAASRTYGNVVGVLGQNRYETATMLALAFGGTSAVVAASGLDFPDALAGSAAVPAVKGALILLPKSGHVGAVWDAAGTLGAKRFYLIGGGRSLPEQVTEHHLYPKYDL